MTYDRDFFFGQVRARMYPGGLQQAQVDGLNFLMERFEADSRYTDQRWVAYALATTKHEADDTYHPILEKGSRSYFDKYEFAKRLGNTVAGDGFLFRGRGYSMITGRRNYTLFSGRLGIDLVGSPDLALDRQVAFQILALGMAEGLFTGKGLSNYFNGPTAQWGNARRIINGLDRASKIADYGRTFNIALRAA